jgi:protein-tyrosine-phosphatase
MSDPVTRILFVDTANSSRSILAEALVRRAGAERFVAVFLLIAGRTTSAALG